MSGPLKKGHLTEPAVVRWTITAIAFVFIALFLVVPLVAVFGEAFAKGWEAYRVAIVEPDALEGGLRAGAPARIERTRRG